MDTYCEEDQLGDHVSLPLGDDPLCGGWETLPIRGVSYVIYVMMKTQVVIDSFPCASCAAH